MDMHKANFKCNSLKSSKNNNCEAKKLSTGALSSVA